MKRRTLLAVVPLAGIAASCRKAQKFLPHWLEAPDLLPSAPFTPPTGAIPDLISHTLNRLTWGPSPGEHERISALAPGQPEKALQLYLDQQLSPADIPDPYPKRVLGPMEAIREPLAELYEYKPTQLREELTRQTIVRAVHSNRQLQEVMVDFWTDHFNIDSSKLDCRWLKTVDDRTVIRPHALGSFPAMLRASALSPAMLFYLDGRANKSAGPDIRPNENYARELMELHTMGVGSGYTQQDIKEAARCLTGWTVTGRESRTGIGRVLFQKENHDDGAKTILGLTIAAGGGATDLDTLLDIVARHPATSRYIAGKLYRRFISDHPDEATINLTAATFAQSNGDIAATLRTLILSKDFADPRHRNSRIKRPFHFVVSALRTSAAATNGGPSIQRALRNMGHAPYLYPTPEGPPPDGNDWLATLLHRWDFAASLVAGTLDCRRPDIPTLTKLTGGTTGLLRHFLGREPEPQELHAATAVNAPLALILASPAFQTF